MARLKVSKAPLTGLVLLCGFLSPILAGAGPAKPERLTAREIQAKPGAAASPFLSRPVAVVCGGASVYVLDAADADIKVYSREGEFLRAVGRKGQGPGEFRLPNDLDVLRGRLYVADSANRRLQILDEAGTLLGGFSLTVTPWRILALGEDRILVAALPSGRAAGEKIVHCFNAKGDLIWRAVEPLPSDDSVHGALRNQVFIRRSTGGGFLLLRSFDDRLIRALGADGSRMGETPAPEKDLPYMRITVPVSGGRKKTVGGFCWACAADAGRLYLLRPEYTDDKDLGPGRTIAVFDEDRGFETLIEVPERITRFAVAGRTIYAVDTEARLRIFTIGSGDFGAWEPPHPLLRPEAAKYSLSRGGGVN